MKTKNKISKRVENKLTMFKVVVALCSKNVALLMIFSGVYDAYVLYKTKVGELESLVKQKILIISGLTDDKKQTKILLAELAFSIASAIHALAGDAHNYDLMKQVNYTDKKIIAARDNICIQICNNIYELGMANLPALAPWGVDANVMQTLLLAIGLYNDKSTLPTEAIKHRATLTDAIEAKIHEIDYVKEHQLDVSVNRLKSQNKIFVSDYYKESQIIDLGIRHRKPDLPIEPDALGSISGKIGDGHGKAIKGATIILTGEEKTYMTITDKDGYYVQEGVLDGTYSLQVILYGKKLIKLEDVVMNENVKVVKDFTMEDAENDTVNKPK